METPRVVMAEVERFGFSDNPTYDKLLNELANISGDWRKTKDDHLVEKYRAILRTLVFIGYNDELPIELELPETLMPLEYLEQFGG